MPTGTCQHHDVDTDVIDLTSDTEADGQQPRVHPLQPSSAMRQQPAQQPPSSTHQQQTAVSQAATGAGQTPPAPMAALHGHQQLLAQVQQELLAVHPAGQQQPQHSPQQQPSSSKRRPCTPQASPPSAQALAAAAAAAAAGGAAAAAAAAAEGPPAKRSKPAGSQHSPPAGSTGRLAAAAAGAAGGSEGSGLWQWLPQFPRRKTGLRLDAGTQGGAPAAAADNAGGSAAMTALAAAAAAAGAGGLEGEDSQELFGHFTAVPAAAAGDDATTTQEQSALTRPHSAPRVRAAATAAASTAGGASQAQAGQEEVCDSAAAGMHDSEAASQATPAAAAAAGGALGVGRQVQAAQALALAARAAAAAAGALLGDPRSPAGEVQLQEHWQQLGGPHHPHQQQQWPQSAQQQQQQQQEQVLQGWQHHGQQERRRSLPQVQQPEWHTQQQPQQQQELLPAPFEAVFGGYDQQHQQQLAAADPLPAAAAQDGRSLNETYLAWPPLPDGADSSPDFDLIPASSLQPGAAQFMRDLVQQTQPRNGKARDDAERVLRAARARQQQGEDGGWAPHAAGVFVKAEPWEHKAGAKRGRGRPKRAAADAGRAAAAAAAKALAGSFGAASGGGGGDSSTCGSAGAGSAGRCGWAAGASGTAAAAAGGERSAAAAAAAAGELLDEVYTWQEAPCGQFYRLDTVDVNGKEVALLTPVHVIDRAGWEAELRALEKRTRVEVVTDTCHPCLHNPVRPAILPPSQHYMLTARTELGKGSLLGLYWGDVMTMWEDSERNNADLTCQYGLSHAYLMTAACSTQASICDKAGERGEVMIAGDQSHCRMALINDVKFWADEMKQQGWGPCLKSAQDPASCNCEKYRAVTAEDYGAFINVEWRHFVYKTNGGDFVPAIAAYTNQRVPEGQELYTTYEKLSNGFWGAIRGNLAQYCFVDTLSKRADGLRADMQRMLACVRQAQDCPLKAQLEAACMDALTADAERQQDLSVLLQEARAVHMGQQIPPEVAEARRRTAAAGAAAAAAAAAAGRGARRL